MVEWSKWTSGSYSIGADVAANGVTSEPPEIDRTYIVLNQEYTKRIEEIRALALRIDDPSRGELVSAIQDTYMSYKDTGILTKEEMVFLNRAYKFLTFEAKYHPDKESTIGRINEILGGRNGK